MAPVAQRWRLGSGKAVLGRSGSIYWAAERAALSTEGEEGEACILSSVSTTEA